MNLDGQVFFIFLNLRNSSHRALPDVVSGRQFRGFATYSVT